MQFITFMMSGEKYALNLDIVREVVSDPKLSKIPSAVEYVPWICDLRGHTIPVVDLRKYLKLEGAYDEGSEVIVLSKNERMIGILVDSTKEMLTVSDQEYEETSSGNVKGTLCLPDGRLIPVIDLDRIFQHGKSIEKHEETQIYSGSEILITIFKIKEHSYAFITDQVREITRFVNPSHLPDAPHYVKGLIRVREDLMPLLDLSEILDLGTSTSIENSSLLLVEIGNGMVAFIVDEVEGITSVPKRSLTIRSDFGEKIFAVSDLKGRLVTILNPEKLVDERVTKFSTKSDATRAEETQDEVQIMVFKLADQDFGVLVENVEEVARTLKTRKLPGASLYIEGVVRLRDEVLPLVDLRKRYGFPTDVESANMIVVHLGDKKFALGVDRVEGIVGVNTRSIDEIDDRAFGTRKVAKLKTGELIPLIEIEDVLKSEELEKILQNIHAEV